jgi:5-methyltetrahydrofolate--homocysteine methyltransferase
VLLVAQTLNSASRAVFSALQARDRAWLERMARRLARADADIIDCNASALGPAEGSSLEWMSEIVETIADRPISIDSAHPEILVRVARRRRHAPILNSISTDPSAWPEELPALVSERGARLILQLRKHTSLPSGREDRLRWTLEAVARLESRGVPPEALWIDPVMLPWGDDLGAGKAIFEFMGSLPESCPGLSCVVAISNVSWGHSRRRELHRRWLQELRALPVDAVIGDPFDRELVRLIRG